MYTVIVMEQTGDAERSNGAGPLAGVRVVELGSFIAGPFAGQLLGDYGAEVIKIEPPGTGDVMRRWGVMREGESLWWPAIARNKRSVTLDLRRAEGVAIARRLIAAADVVVENFRPGQLESWGLGYDLLAAENPGLVMVHVSGFGRSGPRANEAGFGSIGEAMGGIRHTTGDPDGPSSRCGISLGDSLASLFAVIGTLSALLERNRSGRGQEVDVAIYEAVAALMESSLADHALAGLTRGRSGGVLPGVAPSNGYPTADGSEVLIAANADTVFARLCETMDRLDLLADSRYATHEQRGENSESLDTEIARWTSGFDAAELLELLAADQVPAGRIYTAADALADPHYLAREMVLHLESATGLCTPMTGVVPKFSATPGSVRSPGPSLGADTAAVLDELAGVDPAQYDELRRSGIV